MRLILMIVLSSLVMGLEAQVPDEEAKLAALYSRASDRAVYTPSDSSAQWDIRVVNLGNDRYQFQAKGRKLDSTNFRAIQVQFDESTAIELDSRSGWASGTNTYIKNFIAKTKDIQFISGSITWDKEYKFNFVLKFRKI